MVNIDVRPRAIRAGVFGIGVIGFATQGGSESGTSTAGALEINGGVQRVERAAKLKLLRFAPEVADEQRDQPHCGSA